MKEIVNQLAQELKSASTPFAGGSPLFAEYRLKPRLARRKGECGRAFRFEHTEEA